MRRQLAIAALVCVTVLLSAVQVVHSQEELSVADEHSVQLAERDRLNKQHRDLYAQGKLREAVQVAKQALDINQRFLGEEHTDTAASYNTLGTLLWELDDYPPARTYYDKSLAITRKLRGEEHANTATVHNNLGVLLNDLGDNLAAREHYETALSIRRKVLGDEHPSTADSYSTLGNLSKDQGDYAAAFSSYEKALAIRRSALGEEHADTANSYSNLGSLCQHIGDYPAARHFSEKALAIRRQVLGEEHIATAASHHSLGVVLRGWGDYPAAREHFETALAIKRKILGEEHSSTNATYEHMVLLEAKLGDLPAAARWMDIERRGSRRYIARLLPTLSEREQSLFLKVYYQRRGELAMSLVHCAEKNQPIAQLGATWLLNSKGVAHEALVKRMQLLRDANDEKRASLVDQLNTIRGQLAQLSLQMPEAGSAQQRLENISSLRAEETSVVRELSLTGGSEQFGDPWIELEAVRKALSDDEMLIEWVRFRPFPVTETDRAKRKWQPAHYAAFVIPPLGAGDVRLVDVGEAQPIDALIENIRNQLTEPTKEGSKKREANRGALQDVSVQLAQKIWQPLAAHVGQAKKLILSPDDAMWLVPWSALLLDEDKFLVEKYSLRYVISGRDLVRTALAQKARLSVVMADPDFDLLPGKVREAAGAVLGSKFKANGQTAASNSRSLLGKVKSLQGTAREAAAIKPSIEKLTGKPPTEYKRQYALESIAKALTAPHVVVFSTHGFFLPDQEIESQDNEQLTEGKKRSLLKTKDGKPLENPLLRCGLLFAGCNMRTNGQAGSSDDGVLTGMEVVGIDFRGTDLVVLSACETGVGELNVGEGVAGLRQAFQLAGANAVVATLWQIPDDESALLMNAFFAKLAEGQSKAEALQYAQRSLIRQQRDKGQFPHPFYWGAYTVTGR